MTKYDLIFEALEELVYNGYLTIEEAKFINDRAYDKYIVEKSARQKETNKKFSSLLNKYNYDPKTKTIEVDGTKTRVNVNREDPYDAGCILKVDEKIFNREVKRLIANGMNKKDAEKKVGNMLRYSGHQKINSISIGNQIDEFGLLHEIGHVKDESNKRKIKREQPFINKYGRSSLSKDIRKELLKNEYLDERDNDKIQKNIEKAIDEKNDKNQKLAINYKKINEAIDCQNRTQRWNDKRLNKHDEARPEYRADLYAMLHHDEHKFTDDNKKYLDRLSNESDHKFFKRPLKVFSNPDNENRQSSRNELMKRKKKLITDTFK